MKNNCMVIFSDKQARLLRRRQKLGYEMKDSWVPQNIALRMNYIEVKFKVFWYFFILSLQKVSLEEGINIAVNTCDDDDYRNYQNNTRRPYKIVLSSVHPVSNWIEFSEQGHTVKERNSLPVGMLNPALHFMPVQCFGVCNCSFVCRFGREIN